MAVEDALRGSRLDRREMTRRLRALFGFRNFRPGQWQAVESAVSGKDTIVVIPCPASPRGKPTGAGQPHNECGRIT